MKYLSYVLVAGGLAAAMCSMPVLHAEDNAAGMKNHEHHGMMGEKLKDKLGLSNDQAEKLKAAMKARWEAEKPLRQQLHEDVKKLQAQVTLKYKDADIQATLDDMTKAHKAMQAEHEKFISSINSILNPTQRAKLLLSMMKHMRHGGEGWGGHEGHEGFDRSGHGDHHGNSSDMKDAPNDGEGASDEPSQDAQY